MIYRSDRHRRKALKLLIIIILEFFLCWTPLYIYHTIGTFQKHFYRSTPSFIFDLILLFSFLSALSNPLTYYFMSKRYRNVLFIYLTCCQKKSNRRKTQEANQFIQALRLHQQENFIENHWRKSLDQQRIRSKTLN